MTGKCSTAINLTLDQGPFTFAPLNHVAPKKSQAQPSVWGREQVLDGARDCVMRDRAATHGAVEESFTTLAKIWSARLGVAITAEQVTIMMIDLKGVRAWKNPGHADNWVDMAGYAACGGEQVQIPYPVKG